MGSRVVIAVTVIFVAVILGTLDMVTRDIDKLNKRLAAQQAQIVELQERVEELEAR